MKPIKALLAIALACALALGLSACAPEEEEEPELLAKTPLEAAQSDPLAYLNTLVGLVRGAEGFVMETGYAMDDIEAGNDALQAARGVVKGYIIDYIKGSLTYSKKPKEGKESVEIAEKGYKTSYVNGVKKDPKARGEESVNLAERCPALFSALLAGDLLEDLKISDVLELEVAKRLEDLEKDLKEGRNTSMKGKNGEEKREYVLGQMSESAVKDASGLYQIEGKLSPAAAERLLSPADKEDILAQLAKAKEYVLVEDYSLEHIEFTLLATVSKIFIDKDKAADQVRDPALAEDHIKELRLELKSGLTATAAGTGAFEGEGKFPIALTLKKTVKYKDIKWEEEKENENA